MPPKRRTQNQGLPARWRQRGKAFYYRVPKGDEHLWDGKTEYPLGSTMADAAAKWSDKMRQLDRQSTIRTMPQAFDRYELVCLPELRPATQTDYRASIKRLRVAFQNFAPHQVTVADAKEFHRSRVRNGGGPVAAKHDVGVLRAVLTACVDWGVIPRNDLIGQLKYPTAVSDRVVTPDEVAQIMTLPVSDQMRAYCEIKVLTGLHRYDMLRLHPVDRYTGDTILVVMSKHGRGHKPKRIPIEITPALRDAMVRAQAARPVQISPWLFCDLSGGSYMREDGTAPAFRSRWQRFQKRLIRDTKITETFKDSDLRAYASDEFEDERDAQALLGHGSVQTTRRHYRRRARKVKPTR